MLGILAFFLPQVLGGGYNWVQSAIDGKLAFWLMAALVAGKIVSTSLTISSGGSGGAFAPSLFIGAMLGGSYGSLLGRFFPQIVAEPAAFVLVGMGGFLAGVAKVPVAAMIMVAEMTGGYSLILPMMVTSGLAYLMLGKRVTLFEKQVGTRVDSPAHIGDYAVDIMDRLIVRDAVPEDRRIDTVAEGMGFENMMQFMVNSNQEDFPVVDGNGRLTGVLSMTDLREAMAHTSIHSFLLAKDIATGNVVAVTMEDSLNTALKLMAEANVRELPVVIQGDQTQVISSINRKDITRTYHDEMERLKGS